MKGDLIEQRKEKKRRLVRFAGILMIVCGVGVLGLYAYRKIGREIYLRNLLRDNINFEIPAPEIKVPAPSAAEITASPGITAPFMPRSSMISIRSGAATRCISWTMTQTERDFAML